MAERKQKEILSGNTGLLLGFSVGIVAGIMLLVMLPGVPWAWKIEGDPTTLDLVAQQSMAAAAWWMVVVSILSTAASMVALYFILKTWEEAKRSADAADRALDHAAETSARSLEMGRAQVRAYLVISYAEFRADSAGNIRVEFEFKNSGQTPARAVVTAVRVEFARRSQKNWEEIGAIPANPETRSDIPASEQRDGRSLTKNVDELGDGDFIWQETQRVVATLYIAYDDVFGIRHTDKIAYGAYVDGLGDANFNLYRQLDGREALDFDIFD